MNNQNFKNSTFNYCPEKPYFNLTENNVDLSKIVIRKQNNFNCQLIDKLDSKIYKGFKLPQTHIGYTLCDINFQKSNIDRKYQVRLIFCKTDNNLYK